MWIYIYIYTYILWSSILLHIILYIYIMIKNLHTFRLNIIRFSYARMVEYFSILNLQFLYCIYYIHTYLYFRNSQTYLYFSIHACIYLTCELCMYICKIGFEEVQKHSTITLCRTTIIILCMCTLNNIM